MTLYSHSGWFCDIMLRLGNSTVVILLCYIPDRLPYKHQFEYLLPPQYFLIEERDTKIRRFNHKMKNKFDQMEVNI